RGDCSGTRDDVARAILLLRLRNCWLAEPPTFALGVSSGLPSSSIRRNRIDLSDLKIPGQYARNTLCRMAIPEGRRLSRFSLSAEDLVRLPAESLQVAAYQKVGAGSRSDWAFRVFPYSQARNSEKCCLLLNATRVGNHHRGAGLESEEFQIRQRI